MSVKIRSFNRSVAWGPLLPVVVLALVACGKQEAARPAPTAVEVSTLTVHYADVPVAFEFVGQTESSQQVEIRARVEGFLEKRVYTEGAVVKPGQRLFVMDAKPFQAQLQAARGELEQQKARLVTARANLARVKPLAAQNALSQKDLDDATGQEQAAAAAVESRRDETAMPPTGISPSPTYMVSCGRGITSPPLITHSRSMECSSAARTPSWRDTARTYMAGCFISAPPSDTRNGTYADWLPPLRT